MFDKALFDMLSAIWTGFREAARGDTTTREFRFVEGVGSEGEPKDAVFLTATLCNLRNTEVLSGVDMLQLKVPPEDIGKRLGHKLTAGLRLQARVLFATRNREATHE